MSRGHGRIQRRVVDLLCGSEALKEGLPLAALRPALGPDRSNARRAVQALIRRGDAVWIYDPETGERRLKLTFLVSLRELWRRNPPDYGQERPRTTKRRR